jgi:uncharacterized protein YlaI
MDGRYKERGWISCDRVKKIVRHADTFITHELREEVVNVAACRDMTTRVNSMKLDLKHRNLNVETFLRSRDQTTFPQDSA